MDESLQRIEKMLAQILLQSLGTASQGEKAFCLHRVGFENSDIAKLLGTTAASVSQQLYAQRKGGAKKRPQKKAAAK